MSEITIEPADNGYVVRHYRESTNKNEPGKTIRKVAANEDDALEHARDAMGGGAKRKPKKRDGSAEPAGETVSGITASHRRSIVRRPRRRVSRRR